MQVSNGDVRGGGRGEKLASVLLIISIMRRLVYALIPLLIVASLGSSSFASEVSAAAVIQEMNVARQNPAVYAEALERVRPTTTAGSFSFPVRQKLSRTKASMPWMRRFLFCARFVRCSH